MRQRQKMSPEGNLKWRQVTETPYMGDIISSQCLQDVSYSEPVVQIYLKPKVTLHCYYIYLFWVLVSGILNVFNSY